MNAFFTKDSNNRLHLWIKKSVTGGTDDKLAYFKRCALKALKAAAIREAKNEKKEIQKALLYLDLMKSGAPIGTIQDWPSGRYKKSDSGRWVRIGAGRKASYNAETKGAKIAIKAVMRNVARCGSYEELLRIVVANKSRFSDDNGLPLPFVQQLMDAVSEKHKGFKAQRKAERAKTSGGEKQEAEAKPVEKPQAETPKKTFDKKKIAAIYKRDSLRKLKDQEKYWKAVLSGEAYESGKSSESEVETAKVHLAVLEKLIKKAKKQKQKAVSSPLTTKPQEPTKPLTGIDALREKYSAFPSVTGDDYEINLPGSDETMLGRWKLVEADAPSASHDEQTFNKTADFPTADNGGTVNDRDYEHDKAAKENVITVAASYDGRAVSIDEPVVVTEDGVVISGNNRTMSSKLAAKNGTDKKYIAALAKKAKMLGFTSSDVAKFKHPRVVFEVKAPEKYTTELFAQFNKSDKKAMSPVEAAVKVCKTIKIETIENIAGKIADFDTMGEMYADNRAMTSIFDTLIGSGTITRTDLPMYFTENGVTGAGKEFLETALIGSVINETNIRQLSSEGGKAIRQKLVRAILPLVENKGMDGYSINAEMNDAVHIALAVAKDKDTYHTIDDYVGQGDMFGEKIDPVAVKFAEKLQGTQKEFAKFMLDLNCGLRPAANGEMDIFAGGVKTKKEILNEVLSLKKSLAAALAMLGA